MMTKVECCVCGVETDIIVSTDIYNISLRVENDVISFIDVIFFCIGISVSIFHLNINAQMMLNVLKHFRCRKTYHIFVQLANQRS